MTVKADRVIPTSETLAWKDRRLKIDMIPRVFGMDELASTETFNSLDYELILRVDRQTERMIGFGFRVIPSVHPVTRFT